MKTKNIFLSTEYCCAKGYIIKFVLSVLLGVILLASSTMLFAFPKTGATQRELSNNEAKAFILALLNNSDALQNFVDTTELKLSHRLDISYVGIKHKFLIANIKLYRKR